MVSKSKNVLWTVLCMCVCGATLNIARSMRFVDPTMSDEHQGILPVESTIHEKGDSSNTSLAMIVQEKIFVDWIWPAVSVEFCLLTHGNEQYVAYFDSDRRMAVGERLLAQPTFRKTSLTPSPSSPGGNASVTQGWDSHNYITMAVDSHGFIHLAGNMHRDALTYFRSKEVGDASTLEQVTTQVPDRGDEDKVTYPIFLKGTNGTLIFSYRHGFSGNGEAIFNHYNPTLKKWTRLIDEPILSGRGRGNAYMVGPIHGPDGWYHMGWVWRDTNQCETSHDPSYARSRDLIHWENTRGELLVLPITIGSNSTIIDDVPIDGGLINGGLSLGFDSNNKVVAAYHKFDNDGYTQAYVARIDQQGRWVSQQVSSWEYRWHFSGGGSIDFHVQIGAITVHDPGTLILPYNHKKYGSGTFVLAETTLERVRIIQEGEDPSVVVPPSLREPTSDFPGMQVNWANDIGGEEFVDNNSHYKQDRFALRWEAMGPHRDLPREGPLPEKRSELILYRFEGRSKTKILSTQPNKLG